MLKADLHSHPGGVPVPEHCPISQLPDGDTYPLSSLSQATLHAAFGTQESIAFHCCMSKGFLVHSSNTDCMAYFALETMCWLFCLLPPPSPFFALLCAQKAELHTWHHLALLPTFPSWVKLMGTTGREIKGQEERKVKEFIFLILFLL